MPVQYWWIEMYGHYEMQLQSTGYVSSMVDFILQFYHNKQTNKPKTNNVKKNTIKYN